MSVQELKIRINVTDSGTVKVLEGVSEKTKTLSKNLSAATPNALGLSKSFYDMALNIGKLYAAYRIFSAGFRMVKEISDAGDSIKMWHERTGIATKTLSEFAYMAKFTETDMASLGIGLKTLSGHMDDANKGNEKAQALLASVGIKYKDNAGHLISLDKAFLQAAAGTKKLGDENEQLAKSVDLFGKGALSLIPTLKTSDHELARLIEESHKLGGAWDDLSSNKADAFNDSLKRSKEAFFGLKKAIIIELLPAFTEFANQLTTMLTNAGTNIKTFGAGTISIMKAIVSAVGFTVLSFKGIGLILQMELRALTAISAGVESIITKLMIMWKESGIVELDRQFARGEISVKEYRTAVAGLEGGIKSLKNSTNEELAKMLEQSDAFSANAAATKDITDGLIKLIEGLNTTALSAGNSKTAIDNLSGSVNNLSSQIVKFGDLGDFELLPIPTIEEIDSETKKVAEDYYKFLTENLKTERLKQAVGAAGLPMVEIGAGRQTETQRLLHLGLQEPVEILPAGTTGRNALDQETINSWKAGLILLDKLRFGFGEVETAEERATREAQEFDNAFQKALGSQAGATINNVITGMASMIGVTGDATRTMEQKWADMWQGVLDSTLQALAIMTTKLLAFLALDALTGGALTAAGAAGAAPSFLGGLGNMLGFASGGVIPGAEGAPQIILAHGGEEIRTPTQARAGVSFYPQTKSNNQGNTTIILNVSALDPTSVNWDKLLNNHIAPAANKYTARGGKLKASAVV